MRRAISIDTDGVQVFAGRIRGVAVELDHARSTFEAADTGAACIDDALGDFHGGWSDRRGKLVDALEKAADALDNIVEQFEATDQSLAGDGHAAGGGSGGGGGTGW